MITLIYALRENGFVRYVGKTRNALEWRLADHLKGAIAGGRTYKYCWIRSMLKRGLAPTITLLEVANGDGNVEERKWIAYFKGYGIKLTNVTDGGDGGGTYWLGTKGLGICKAWNKGQTTPENVKQKIRMSLIGRKVSEETRKKLRAAWEHRAPPSDATRQKISKSVSTSLMGHKVLEKTREKLSKYSPWNKGKPGYKRGKDKKHKLRSDRGKERGSHINGIWIPANAKSDK